MSVRRQGRAPGRLSAAAMAPAVVLLAALVYFVFAGDDGRTGGPVTDGSCPAGAEVLHRAVYLVDLRKPLDAAYRALPGEVLDDVTDELAAGTELGVFALSPYPEAPRTLIGRLCKTFDNAELIVATAKDYDGGESDCNDLPAQLSAPLRASAMRFCRQRELLRGRLDALAAAPPSPAENAHLLEAFEDIGVEFAEAAGTLYVFSDMLQHAPWYSHLELPAERWNFAAAEAIRASMPLAEALRGLGEGTRAHVFHVVRAGVTAMSERQTALERFWRDYFGTTEVVFDLQPPMADYVAQRLMDLPTEQELASYERERERHANQLAAERLAQQKAELEAAREALAEEKRQLAEDKRRLEDARRAEARESATAGPAVAVVEGRPGA